MNIIYSSHIPFIDSDGDILIDSNENIYSYATTRQWVGGGWKSFSYIAKTLKGLIKNTFMPKSKYSDYFKKDFERIDSPLSELKKYDYILKNAKNKPVCENILNDFHINGDNANITIGDCIDKNGIFAIAYKSGRDIIILKLNHDYCFGYSLGDCTVSAFVYNENYIIESSYTRIRRYFFRREGVEDVMEFMKESANKTLCGYAKIDVFSQLLTIDIPNYSDIIKILRNNAGIKLAKMITQPI